MEILAGDFLYKIEIIESADSGLIPDVKKFINNKWKECTKEEIRDLLVDGLKFRKLKEAEKIKTEIVSEKDD